MMDDGHHVITMAHMSMLDSGESKNQYFTKQSYKWFKTIRISMLPNRALYLIFMP